MWLTYSCVTLPLLRLLCLCASGMNSIGQETVPGQRGSFDVDRANSDSDNPSGADSLGGSVTRLSGGLPHGERHLCVRHLWRDPSDWVRTVTTRIGQLCNDRPFNKRAEASSDVRIFGHGGRTCRPRDPMDIVDINTACFCRAIYMFIGQSSPVSS